MKIVLYTTHCRNCMSLKKRLEMKNLKFEESTDIEPAIARGFQSAPVLEVDGEFMDFAKAMNWLKKIQ